MNNIAIYFLTALSAGFGLGIIALLLGRSKLTEKTRNLEAKLLASESSHSLNIEPLAKNREMKKPSRSVRERGENDAGAAELLNLRRDVSGLKDELKKHKDELRQKELELKAATKEKENSLYVLSEENRSLIQQLKEAQTAASRKFAPELPPEDTSIRSQHNPSQGEKAKKPLGNEGTRINTAPTSLEAAHLEAKQRLQEAKHHAAELERTLGREQSRQRDQQAKIQDLERELRKFREAATIANGKVLDPSLFVKWKERALEGRKMYQLMKQLRELSDAKLVSYQEAVAYVAENALQALQEPLPIVPEGKLRSDFLLTAAIEAFAKRSPEANETVVPNYTEPSALSSTNEMS